MKLEEIFEKGVLFENEAFKNIFDEAVEEVEKAGVFFLWDDYIDYVNSFGNCLSGCIDELKEAAQNMRQNKELSVYALFVYKAMTERKLFLEHLGEFEFPQGDEAEARLFSFLVYLPVLPQIYKELKEREVPEDVIFATLCQFEECVFLTEERTGKFGLLRRYFDHMQLYVDGMILNIGRLRFQKVPQLESEIIALENSKGEIEILFDGAEINSAGRLLATPPDEDNKKSFTAYVSETDHSFIGYKADNSGNCSGCTIEYPKNEWKKVLGKGDSVLSVHIPSKGALTKEACEESYRRAKEIFKNCYPEFNYKAFHCHSWMLDPQLRMFIKEKSNILAFQSKYNTYAGESEGTEVFNFVFKLVTKDCNDMPEDTSLQRALKKHYLEGKYIYEYEGVFLTD